MHVLISNISATIANVNKTKINEFVIELATKLQNAGCFEIRHDM